MKFPWDKKYLHWGVTAFLVIVASILFFFCLLRFDALEDIAIMVLGILQPILYGLTIAYLLTPVMNFFERYIQKWVQKISKKQKVTTIQKISRSISILITMLLMLLLISALISMIIPQLIKSINGLAADFPDYINQLNLWINSHLDNNPQFTRIFNEIVNKFTQNYEKWWDNLQPAFNSFLAGLTTGVKGIFNAVKNILIGLIVSIYVMFSKETFAAQSKKIVYALLEITHANQFISMARHTHKVFSSFIVGKLIDSFIIGIICFIGMSIFQMPQPLLISVIIGVTNVIPFFGPLIGAIPTAFIILLIKPSSCLYFVIFILVLQQFDGNILGPKILGEATGLSSFWVIFSILVSGGLFGFAGMVIGVPFFAVIYGSIKLLITNSLQKKQLPTKTKDYRSLSHIDTTDKSVIHFDDK